MKKAYLGIEVLLFSLMGGPDMRGTTQKDSDEGSRDVSRVLHGIRQTRGAGATVVAAAGNNGRGNGRPGGYLGDFLPSNQGTDSNSMIPVGGVTSKGSLYIASTPVGRDESHPAPLNPYGGVGSETSRKLLRNLESIGQR
ncbi:hypothetical protein F4778DRAFT_797423 [Xylariomycetidae sp. FL2044]|nr:hypothetical protein F4778DRAFT_797423 [Xylariomycetidae sp. FL2044]